MEKGIDNSLVQTWRQVFTLLASLELGHAPAWAGPEDFEELKLRVETLVLLLGLVPRNEISCLGEVVGHLSAAYPDGATPALAYVRAKARRFLLDQHCTLSLDREGWLERAKAIVMHNHLAVAKPPSEGSVLTSGDRPEDFEQCFLGIVEWFNQVTNDPEWAKVRLFASDEAEVLIDEVFVDVLAVPDADLEASGEGEIERVRRTAGRITGDTHAVIDASTMVSRTSAFCVVVGDPGSGKSTLVQWVARRVMTGNDGTEKIADFDVALVVKLGPFALALAKSPKLTLVEYFFSSLKTEVDDWSGAANRLRKASGDGVQCLLLLDGWDEVPATLQNEVRKSIDRERPFFTIIVTSRPSGFPRRLATGRHAEVYHIAGLTGDGRRTLASRYLRAFGRETLLPELLQQIEGNRDLQELTCNPFMLALLTRAAASGALNMVREWTLGELYHLAASCIIDIAAERNPGHRVRLSRSLGGLGRLSHMLLFDESFPRYVFTAEELIRVLEGDDADPVVESRFVTRVDRLGNRFAFLHATFEEYFAARHSELLIGSDLFNLFDGAFLSASWGIVLEFVIGFNSKAGRECRNRLSRWMEERDRYGQVVYRIARLLAACPGRLRPPALASSIRRELWENITSTQEMNEKEMGVKLFARLDPVALCRAIRAEEKPDQFVVDCITSCVPASVGISERIAELMDPAMRERVEAELWGGRSQAEIEANRQTLSDHEADSDRLREAILFAGASRDVEAVAALVSLLRTPGLPDEIQREVSTSLGLIGGKEASRALVELVTGDIPASHVAIGLARRSLQHTEGGHRRLDPVGRDALLRRIACVEADHQSVLIMLSALQGFPIRTGMRFLKTIALCPTVQSSVRLAYLEALDASLSNTELDEFLRRIGAEGAEIEAMLLAAAVQRRRPVPVIWLSRRLQGSARLPDKQMLLMVALSMSSQRSLGSADIDLLLAGASRDALSSPDARHVDLATAFRSALTGISVDHGQPPLWINAALCRQVLEGFIGRDQDVSAEQVMLAATLISRVPLCQSGELLYRCLSECRDRLTQASTEMQAALLVEVTRAVARALADLDPQALCKVPAGWQPIDEELHILSSRRGWLVFNDRILDREGKLLLAPWQAGSLLSSHLGGDGGSPALDPSERGIAATNETSELEERIRDWFKRNAAEYLPAFQVFWCIGILDLDALSSCGKAKGYDWLDKKLTRLESKNQCLASLKFSQARLRKLLTKELPQLFASDSFPSKVWADNEKEQAFRSKIANEDWSPSNWTPRARRVWQLLDTQFPVAKIDITL